MFTFSYEIKAARMLMMTPCMINGLSIPSENSRFSLLFPINIPIYRIGFKSTTKLWDYYK